MVCVDESRVERKATLGDESSEDDNSGDDSELYTANVEQSIYGTNLSTN